MIARRVDIMFRAFADETRLRILHLLARKKELCVCDIMRILKLPQSKVSRHLAYLRGAGLARDRKDGLWSYYSLAKPEGGFHKRLIGCLDGCFEEVTVLRKDSERLGRFNKDRSRCR
ncbi:MAG: metalloregulator ArsR/SmtB family transcription factor [Elusimicrobia bacterium]|nr:metalloregulator ArsR/SmtB family transcription factor [Elusimicrobiota bacterium]